ncbi:MAG: protoheme IX farnesyltransferase [Bacteroidota bacterium]
MTGYIVCSAKFDISLLFLALGVFVLASGASALNEVQEWKHDALMFRTQKRPIPSGLISPLSAFVVSLLLILIGSTILLTISPIAAALGLFNIIWYNLLYTYLKRVSAFAVVPGSLTGAIPLLMGWTAADGAIFDASIVFIAFFIFIWQIPHFWLLMLKYGNEYQQAGFPTINQSLNTKSLKRIIFSWILASSLTSIMIPLFVVDISLAFFVAIFILNITFVAIFIKLTFAKVSDIHLSKSFISINVYMIIFMLMLAIYRLLGF